MKSIIKPLGLYCIVFDHVFNCNDYLIKVKEWIFTLWMHNKHGVSPNFKYLEKMLRKNWIEPFYFHNILILEDMLNKNVYLTLIFIFIIWIPSKTTKINISNKKFYKLFLEPSQITINKRIYIVVWYEETKWNNNMKTFNFTISIEYQ